MPGDSTARLLKSAALFIAGAAILTGACNTVLTPDLPPWPGVKLVEDGQSKYRIVLDAEASPSEHHAAAELQRQIAASTGVTLPIREGMPTEEGPMIVLGQGEVARNLGVEVAASTIGRQGAVVKITEPHVFITGAPEGGTLFATYRFIEDHLGVRWLAPGVTHKPELDNIEIAHGEQLIKPAFEWRHISYEWPGADDEFRARLGDNHGGRTGDDPLGIQYDGFRGVHTYFRFVGPDEFFDTHPEYFSEIGGVRRRHETQLCLTNPDVLEIVTARMLEKMAADPAARHHNFSQKDQYNYCTCDNCSAMNALYGTSGGTNIWFTNELAKRTSLVYPDKIIKTLAYMYSEEPPVGLELHPNVAVYLCHMFPSCDSHPVESCGLNANYKRRALAWSELTDHLFVWHYAVNFTHYWEPFPNLRAIAADARFYRDIGVEGLFFQGMGEDGGGGELAMLRGYYAAKLLWDPDQDPQALIDEFLTLYYGAAAEPIGEYIDLLHDKVFDDDIHMHLYTNPAQGYLPEGVVTAAEALFEQARQAVANDPVLLDRVRVAELPVKYARFFPRNGYRIEDNELIWNDGLGSFEEILDAVQTMEEFGFEAASEQFGDIDTIVQMGLLLAADWPVYTLQNDHLTVDVAPVVGGRIVRIIDRETGTNVAAFNVAKNSFFPFAGGLEARVGTGFDISGFAEQASVVSHDDLSVTLAVTTMSGLDLTRTLSLATDQPVLTIETEVSNPGDAPHTTRLRHHLELAIGALETGRLELLDGAGNPTEQSLPAVYAREREGIYLFGDAMPEQGLRIIGDNGLTVTQRFDRAVLDHAWVWAFPLDMQQLELEISTPVVELGPGESISLSESLEVRGD